MKQKKVYIVIRQINHYKNGVLNSTEHEYHGVYTQKDKADQLAKDIKERYNDFYNDAFVTEVETDKEIIF